MIFGMTPFTFFHVLISLIGILSGLVVLYGLINADRMSAITLVFLTTTVATSATGFLFPFHGVTPGIIVGGLSLLVLALVIVARYAYRLAGPWRWVYAGGAVIALWFNVFVLVAQSFQKVPALHALAPTATESPFKIAQALVLLLFVGAGVLAVRRFRPAV